MNPYEKARRLPEDISGFTDRQLLAEALEHLQGVTDEGPWDEGWASADLAAVVKEIERRVDTGATTITCPRCGRTSHHAGDVANLYCGACHWWTSDPQLGRPEVIAQAEADGAITPLPASPSR